jgi:hypothetical protein
MEYINVPLFVGCPRRHVDAHIQKEFNQDLLAARVVFKKQIVK